MNTVKVLKNTLPLVASIGVGTVTGVLLKTFAPVDAKIATKISFAVGVSALTLLASNAASAAVEKEIDETAETVRKINDAIINGVTSESEED